MAFSWSSYQQAVFQFIDTQMKNLVIEAVAGSGKSTTLLEIARLMKGKKVGIIAFNSAIAKELKGKIVERQMNDVDAKTFHAAGLYAVTKRVGKRDDVDIDKKKISKIVDALCVSRPDLGAYGSYIEAAVNMAKNLGFGCPGGPVLDDMHAWIHMTTFYSLDDKLPEDEVSPNGNKMSPDAIMEKGIKAAQVVLKRSVKLVLEWLKDRTGKGRLMIDYADMIYLPLVLDLRMWQYECLMVDEAQDLNYSRMLLAKKMVRRGGRFVFVGDPRQNIYGFTGAMNNALEIIKTEFGCHTLPLSVTYRSAKAIVAYAHRVVSHIQAAPNAPEGEVLFWGGDQFEAEELLKTDAILCRVNAPLVTLAFSLIRRGIPCKIEGREIGAGLISLVSKWKVKSLDKLRDRLEGYMQREVEKALAKDQEERADQITDRVNTVFVLIERCAAQDDTSKRNVAGLKEMIEAMFDDNVASQGLLTLCSYHRSKGREFLRVFRLDHHKHCPSRFAKLPHQRIAEDNLDYVATTRAITTLVEINQNTQTLPQPANDEGAKEKEKVAA